MRYFAEIFGRLPRQIMKGMHVFLLVTAIGAGRGHAMDFNVYGAGNGSVSGHMNVTFHGRGAPQPRRGVRLYRNAADEWVRLAREEDGEARELIATPGHHFLDRFGNFPTIEEMPEAGRAMAVLASGKPDEVTAKWDKRRPAA